MIGAGSPKVVIINEDDGEEYFPDENPIGRRLITGIRRSRAKSSAAWSGMSGPENLSLAAGHGECIHPGGAMDGSFISVIVRSSRPAATLRSELSRPSTPSTRSAHCGGGELQELLAQATADRRLSMYLLAAFAGLALALAAWAFTA